MKLFKKKIKERKGVIEFTIEKKDYVINTFTITDYYEVKKVMEDSIGNRARIISILSGCPSETLLQLQVNEFNTLYNLVNTYYISYQYDLEVRKTIKLNNKEYHLIDIGNITVGDYSDIDMLAKQENTLHKQLGILYGAKEDEWDNFLSLDVRDIMGTINFFLSIANKSLTRFLLYSELKVKDKETKAIIRSLKTLLLSRQKPGIDSYASSQEKMLSELKMLSDSLLKKHSISKSILEKEIKK